MAVDPELRLRIPVRGTVNTKLVERNEIIVVRLVNFMAFNVAVEVDTARAARKLSESFAAAAERLDEIEAAREKAKRKARKRKS